MFNFALKELFRAYPDGITEITEKTDGMPTKRVVKWLIVNWYKVRKENEARKRLIALYKLREKNTDKQLTNVFSKYPYVESKIKIETIEEN